MNLYDFDNTIYDGDSSVDFIKYSLLRHPWLVLFAIFKAFKELIKYPFHKSNLGLIKSELFSFVRYIENFDEYINNYVLKKIKNIKKFYLDNQQPDDVVISASFDFIIIPFCQKLGIKNVIATLFDVKKGHIIGDNCKGNEKVKRFKKVYKNVNVEEAYSDSLSDVPMLQLAKRAYLVKGEEVNLYKS